MLRCPRPRPRGLAAPRVARPTNQLSPRATKIFNNSFANKNTAFIISMRGHGSIGRASVSHTEGCGFESH